MAENVMQNGIAPLKGLNRKLDTQQLSDEDKYLLRSQLPVGKILQDYTDAPVQDVGELLAQENYGASIYDVNATNLSQALNLNDIRALNEPGILKLTNGIAKGAILAGSTFLTGTAGLIIGTAGVLGGLAAGEDTSKSLSSFYDNPFTNAYLAVTDWSENAFPNYESTIELNNPFYKNLGTANFWGNEFIKNLGFTVGALASGSAASGLVKGISETLAPLFAKGMQGLSKVGLMDATSLTRAVAQAPSIVASTVGSTISAVNEATIEAKTNMDLFKQTMQDQINNRFLNDSAALGQKYEQGTKEYNEGMLLLSNARTNAMTKIDEDATHMGNVDWLLNIPILTLSNAFLFGRLYSNGFKTARYVNNIVNTGEGAAAKYASNMTAKSALAHGFADALAEGSEEVELLLASDIPSYKYGADVHDYYTSQFNPQANKQATDNVKGWADAISKGFNVTLGQDSTWEQFFIGALTGSLSMPSIKPERGADGKIKLSASLAGGIYGSYKDYREKADRVDMMVNRMNEIMSDPSYVSLWKGFVTHLDLQNKMNQDAANDDKFSFKNHESALLFNDIATFANAGKLDDLNQLVGSAFDLSDENIEAIKQLTQSSLNVALNKVDVTNSAIPSNPNEKTNLKVFATQQQTDDGSVIKFTTEGGENKFSMPINISNISDIEDFQKNEQDKIKGATINSLSINNDGTMAANVNLIHPDDTVETRDVGLNENPILDITDQFKVKKQTKSPFSDKNGNFKSNDDIKQLLQKNNLKVQDAINDYIKANDSVDAATGQQLSDDQLHELAYIKFMSKNWEDRISDISNEVIPTLTLASSNAREYEKFLDSKDLAKNGKTQENPSEVKPTDPIMSKLNLLTTSTNNLFGFTHSLLFKDHQSINNFIDSLSEFKKFGLSDDEINDISRNLHDTKSLYDSIHSFNSKLKEFLSNPQGLQLQLNAIKLSAETQQMGLDASTILNKYTSLPSVKKTYVKYGNYNDLPLLEQDVLQKEADNGNLLIADYIKSSNVVNLIKQSILGSKMNFNAKQLALDKIDEQVKSAKDDLSDVTKLSLNSQLGSNPTLSKKYNYMSDEDLQLAEKEADAYLEGLFDRADANNAFALLALDDYEAKKEKELADIEASLALADKAVEDFENALKLAKEKLELLKKENNNLPAKKRRVYKQKVQKQTVEEKPEDDVDGKLKPPVADVAKEVKVDQLSDEDSAKENLDKNGLYTSMRSATPEVMFGKNTYKDKDGKSHKYFGLGFLLGMKEWLSEKLKLNNDLDKIKAYKEYNRQIIANKYINYKAIDNGEILKDSPLVFSLNVEGHDVQKELDELDSYIVDKLHKNNATLQEIDAMNAREPIIFILAKNKDGVYVPIGTLRSHYNNLDLKQNGLSRIKSEIISSYEKLSKEEKSKQIDFNFNNKYYIKDIISGIVQYNLNGTLNKLNIKLFGDDKPIFAIVDKRMRLNPYNTTIDIAKILPKHTLLESGTVYLLVPSSSHIDQNGNKVVDEYIPVRTFSSLNGIENSGEIKNAVNILSNIDLYDGAHTDLLKKAISILNNNAYTGYKFKLKDNSLLITSRSNGKEDTIIIDREYLDKNGKLSVLDIINDIINQGVSQIDRDHVNKGSYNEQALNRLSFPISSPTVQGSWFTFQKRNDGKVIKPSTTDNAPVEVKQKEKIQEEVKQPAKEKKTKEKLPKEKAKKQQNESEVKKGRSIRYGNKKSKLTIQDNTPKEDISLGNGLTIKSEDEMTDEQKRKMEEMEAALDGIDFRKTSLTKGKFLQQDLSRELDILRTILPQFEESDRIKILDRMINIASTDETAWGMFHNGIIYLYKNAEQGTLYHEAFHGVVNTLLNDAEKDLLMKAAQLKYGNLSKYELEDKLAEDFRIYTISKLHEYNNPVKKVFDKIISFVKNIFSKLDYINHLFYQINNGEFSDRSLQTSKDNEDLVNINKVHSEKLLYNNLNSEDKAYLNERKISKELYDKLDDNIKENLIRCK